jgi:hypothetical protein
VPSSPEGGALLRRAELVPRVELMRHTALLRVAALVAVVVGAILATPPATFLAGAEHELEVRLARPGMRRAGFQLSVRHADGRLAGSQAGELLATGTEVQLVAAHPVAYATHTSAGSAVDAAGEARWRLRWRAPAAPSGAVVFHATANAADDDDSALGDLVYAGSEVSRPADATAARR